jgi:hypothetical protein
MYYKLLNYIYILKNKLIYRFFLLLNTMISTSFFFLNYIINYIIIIKCLHLINIIRSIINIKYYKNKKNDKNF